MKKKKADRPKYFINETVSRPVSKREFLRHSKEQTVGDCILLSDIIKRGVFTRSQVNALVRQNVLRPVKYRARVYFKKDNISEGIKHFSSEPQKLF
jgi:hypothetical protein